MVTFKVDNKEYTVHDVLVSCYIRSNTVQFFFEKIAMIFEENKTEIILQKIAGDNRNYYIIKDRKCNRAYYIWKKRTIMIENFELKVPTKIFNKYKIPEVDYDIFIDFKIFEDVLENLPEEIKIQLKESKEEL